MPPARYRPSSTAPAWPSLPTSLVVMRWRNDSAPDPAIDHSPHMAHIEEPDLGTDRVVLIYDTAVVDGHFPSGEIDQFGAGGAMLRDEGSVCIMIGLIFVRLII